MKFQSLVLVALVVASAALVVDSRSARGSEDQACRDYAAQARIDVSRFVNMVIIKVSPGDICQCACEHKWWQIGFPYAKPDTCCCGNIGEDK